MTTIAVSRDGRTIAACGLAVTQWGLVLSRQQQKIKRANGCVYAVAGPYAALDALIRWYEGGASPIEVPPTSDVEPWTLLVRDKGVWRMFSKAMPYPHDVPLPWAIGSGADMAIGAMEAGASPREAVVIVARRTTVSAGEIDVVEIDAGQ